MLKTSLHLQTEHHSVKFYGALHKFDPQDAQFEEIERFFEEGEKPKVMLVEGWEKLRFSEDLDVYRKAIEELPSLTRGELIQKFGDRGGGFYLALKHNIPVFSPEPPFADEIKHIASLGFDKDHIFVSYHARLLYQFRMEKNGKTLEEYLTGHIEDFARASGWPEYDFSYANFLAISARIWPTIKSFDELDDWSVVEIMAPVTSPMSPRYTQVNVISKEEMAYRDGCILNDIIQFMRACNHVFVIYGRGHLSSLETPLKLAIERCFGRWEEVS